MSFSSALILLVCSIQFSSLSDLIHLSVIFIDTELLTFAVLAKNIFVLPMVLLDNNFIISLNISLVEVLSIINAIIQLPIIH